jgi:hypothetical protein
MVLSESLQAVVEAMHTSKAQGKQVLSRMLRVGIDTDISPWYYAPFPLVGKGWDGEIVLILSQMQRETEQYLIPPHETARVMYSVPLGMRSRSSVV